MAGFFSSFGKPSSQLGVDIGTSSIKVVELKRGDQIPALSSYALLDSQSYLMRTSGAIQSSSVKLSGMQLTEMLKLAKDRGNFSTNSAVASVPPYVAFTAMVEMPQMKPSELESAVSFQARQYIPIPLEQVSLQWLKVAELPTTNGNSRELVMLSAVPLEYVNTCKQAFANAGLSLASLEIESLALVRGAVGPDQTPTLIIDIGAQSTSILIAEAGQLTFAEQADVGGATVTQALAKSLGLNPIRAEALKRERGLVDTGPGREMAGVALLAVDAMVGEIKKALYTYESRFQKKVPAERVLLTGGGSNLRGLEAQLGTILQLPAAKAAPLYRVEYPAGLEPLFPELNPELALAVGLALPAVS